jgi:hypothetical protein
MITGLLLVPTMFITGIIGDKTPAWKMILIEYILLLFFLIVFAARDRHSHYEDFVKLLGFAGCLFFIFNIYLTVRVVPY